MTKNVEMALASKCHHDLQSMSMRIIDFHMILFPVLLFNFHEDVA